MRNPFTPTFGVTPPLLVGRDEILQEFSEALADGVGAPARSLLLTGARGSGKTVLLNALEDLAVSHGWAVLSLTTRPGIVAELNEVMLPQYLERCGNNKNGGIKQMQATALGFGAGFTKQDAIKPLVSLRSQLFDLADALSEKDDAGVLISLDEVHRSAAEDLRELTQEIQHAFRQGKNIAFVAAGLPEAVNDLLRDEILTFLRRSERFTLGSVSLPDIEHALEVPVEQNGKRFTGGALELASQGTKGYPYLIQSIGYEVWRAARNVEEISVVHVEVGVQKAMRRIGALVHEPALAVLSDVDKSFLTAMAVDDGPSRMSDINERLGISSQYGNSYKKRLLGHEIIHSPRHGYVDFTIPYLREYLKEYAVSDRFEE